MSEAMGSGGGSGNGSTVTSPTTPRPNTAGDQSGGRGVMRPAKRENVKKMIFADIGKVFSTATATNQ
uniref:Uncharacterized protein n=1 Tax=Nelumbo nucifera TaxID=4432 RepID=A0A822Z9W3_NELNU|nr:TPA_asm: hypothetical protein HUJ06_014149 [Nelumbo nucifera]